MRVGGTPIIYHHKSVTIRYTLAMDGYLTLREATEQLGLKDASGLRHAVRRGYLRTERVGYLHVTRQEWLDAYAAHARAYRTGQRTTAAPPAEGDPPRAADD